MLARKLVISFWLLVISLFITPVAAFAQTTTPSSNLPFPTSISPTSPVYTDLLVHNLFHTFSCLSVGSSVIGQPCLTYQITKDAQGAIHSVPVLSQVNLSGGALGATTSLIGMLYANPPVRTIDYLASLGEGLGIVKPAHAQVVGSGAQVLNPILTLWQVSRNISYLIMIIIFIIIGLMVMFRTRINPQTVITAQAALPGLVLGLILITFSYFFAGLISDMAFVGTNMVGYYFAAAQGKTDDPDRVNLVQKISDKNVLNIFSPLTGIVGQDKAAAVLDAILNQLPAGVQTHLRVFAGFLTTQFVSPLAGGIPPPWGLIAGPAVLLISGLAVGTFPTFFLGFFLSFVATLALIYAMLKLLLRLISSFLTIIFLTISAPFQFLAAALPGRQDIATGWILNMLANILVFPAVLAVFYFVAFILGPDAVGADYPLKVSHSNQVENNALVPAADAAEQLRIVGNASFPLFGGLNLDFIKILLAFGALMALPKIPDIVVSTIGRMGQAGQLLGQEISGGIGAGQRYAGQYGTNVAGGVGGIKRGLLGETTYHWDGTKWIPYYGRPGLKDIGQGWNWTPWRRRP